MKKYILTDKQGFTAAHDRLKPGRFTHAAKSTAKKDPMLRTIASGSDSPLLAILESPDAVNPEAKLFMLNTWNISIDSADPKAYTTVKEVPIPAVSAQHKMLIAINMVHEIYKDEAFEKWARGWLSGEDRSAESARAIKKAIEKENAENKELQELSTTFAAAGNTPEQAQEQQDILGHAWHVVNAAELADNSDPNSNEVSREIASAVKGIEKYADVTHWAELAERVINTKAAA